MGVFRKYANKGFMKYIYIIYMKIKTPLIIDRKKPEEILHTLDEIKQADKRIFYCGICESSNMGDIAQTICTRKWLKTNYPEYDVIECKTSLIMYRDSLIEGIKQYINDNDLFFFQSGYNTHDLGGVEDLMHQKIMQAFPHHTMIMLPQTVYFNSKERKEQCSKIYNNHKNLLFLSRDPVSQKLAETMFPDLTVMLFPDIVTTLIGYRNEKKDRKGIYLCRRNDVEQYYSEKDYVSFRKVLEQLDNVAVSDTIISASNKEIYQEPMKYIDEMIEMFESFRLVVTDKFHGLIFALITNTPVIVLKTKDHKVTSGYDWFHTIFPDRVYFAETEADILKQAEEILKAPSYSCLDNYFDREYYMKLKDTIISWGKLT